MTKVARNPGLWVLLLLLSIIFMGPLVVMGLTALKTPGDAQAADWSFWPSEFTARAFEVLFSSPDNPLLRWFLNSMIAASAHSVLADRLAARVGAGVPLPGTVALLLAGSLAAGGVARRAGKPAAGRGPLRAHAGA